MVTQLTAPDLLNREYLELRTRILDLAAAFDRIDRAEASVAEDPRMKKLYEGIALLAAEGSDRAEQVQLLFSRAYDDSWPEHLGVDLPG